MRIAFEYDLGNGPVVVVCSPLAIVEYERANRTKISRLAADGVGISDMAELVWRQLALDGTFELDLDAFTRKLVDIGPAEVPDPT